MATMTINLPNRPQGSKVEVDGLGEFENGETVELSDEQLDSYERRMGRSFGAAFKNAHGFEFEGVEFPPDEEPEDAEEESTPAPTPTPKAQTTTSTPATPPPAPQSTTGAGDTAGEDKGEGDK